MKTQNRIPLKKHPAKPDLRSGFAEASAAYSRGDFQTASKLAERLLAHYPKQEDLLNLKAAVFAQTGQTEAAVAVWMRIPENRRSHSVWSNLGNAYRKLKRFDEAERHLRRSLALKADAADVWQNLASVLFEADKKDEAKQAFDEVLKRKPNHAAALEYAAMLRFNSGDYAGADIYQKRLLALQPERFKIWLDNAWAHRRLKNYAESERSYRKALALQDDVYDAWVGLSKMLHFQRRYEEACGALERALKLRPDSIEAQSDLVLNRLYIVNRAAEVAADSFRLGDLYAAQAVDAGRPSAMPSEKTTAKLRIGLVSSDLRRHPVGMFAKGLLLSEAALQFEWAAYHNSPIYDELSQEIRPAFQIWRDIKDLSDEEAVRQIRSDGIDILIDLNGHTAGARMGIFAAQAAPLQISWLGYFATTGLPTVQAVLADGWCVPEPEEQWFREKVYRLPHTRLCMAPPKTDIPVNGLPALTNGYITFGCFQNLTKLNDNVLKTWAAVAKKFPSAHWRFQSARLENGSTEQTEFEQRLLAAGFSDGTLHFHGHSGSEQYYAAHHEVDLILDTFPFPGGTTTTDALWMGVPTLTLALEGMLGRQGQQLMSASGYPEWVAHRLEDYLTQAFYWADKAHWAELAAVRQTMRAQAAQSPVYDTEQFARDWCETVKQVWRDFQTA